MKGRSLGICGIHTVFWTALAADAALEAADAIVTGVGTGQSMWRPSWVLAAVFMGRGVLHWPAIFDFAAITAGMAALLPFCFCYTVVIGVVVSRCDLSVAGFAAVAGGVIFYFASRYGLSRWRAGVVAELGWPFLIGHIVLALTAMSALRYRARQDRCVA